MPGVTADTVRMFLCDHDHLDELVKIRNQVAAQLQQLEFDIHLQHQRTLSYLSTPMLTVLFLQWADQNVTHQDEEVRGMAQRMRSVIERSNTAPLFEDGTTPRVDLSDPERGDDLS